MILSMTGFGRGTAVLNGREITVELRSVNSRYFEYSSRIPRTCSYLDSRLKKQLNERITRGKVELSMTIQNVDAADTVVTVNMELARSYQQAMRDLSEQLGVKNDISAAVLTRFPDVLATRHADVDEEQLWEDVSAVTAQALDRFVEMRAAEGAKMKADVENRLNFLEECVGKVETLSAGRVEAYTNRLYEKLKDILEDRDIDDARVLTEAAIFGDKTAVDEETVRLRSHISQYRGILQLNEPVGRKLDFLTQELNRETNTIGSKCQDLDITRIVVDMKAEIEKIRERFVPFLNICKAHGTAIRIGVNHGSLSDRIMSRYGDTPEGMVASCMEFLRICREENFPDVVISIKASNTVVMVRTVRLLVRTMEAENMHYPLHLGVTEAGDGEDGRIKSAVGIGTLLCDGIGDTIRVSLSEDPEAEMPVARKLVDYIRERENHRPIEASMAPGFDTVATCRRISRVVEGIGGTFPPVVISDRSNGDF